MKQRVYMVLLEVTDECDPKLTKTEIAGLLSKVSLPSGLEMELVRIVEESND